MVWYDSGVWKCTLFSPSDDMDCMDYYVWYGMVWYAQNCMNFESGGGFFLFLPPPLRPTFIIIVLCSVKVRISMEKVYGG